MGNNADRFLQPTVAFALGRCGACASNKKARERPLARANRRTFGEYSFLEDSRYTSQLEMCDATELSGLRA
jgi:hypothetical protein